MIDYILTILFWLLVLLVTNSFLIYLLVIWMISKLKNYKHNKESYPHLFKISILISAYNEEKVIEQRINNIINQSYDMNKIEILVGSDCSTDNTNSILNKLSKSIPQLKVYIFDVRRGKAGVLNELIKYASNDILILSDANTEFAHDAIRNLVKHFTNPLIGGVSGRLILQEKEYHKQKGIEEKKYWKYETFIKKIEGKLGILIGANGGILAIRKKLFVEIPTTKPVTDDLFLSLSILQKGYKFIYEQDAIAYEEIPKNLKNELNRKIRFSATNIQTLSFFKALLFHKNLLISYAFWSHKIIRWFLPIILIIIFLINIFLINYHIIYFYTFYIQLFFYLAGIIGFILNKLKIRIGFLSLITYFLLTNIALLIGIIKFFLKKHSVIWQSTPR